MQSNTEFQLSEWPRTMPAKVGREHQSNSRYIAGFCRIADLPGCVHESAAQRAWGRWPADIPAPTPANSSHTAEKSGLKKNLCHSDLMNSEQMRPRRRWSLCLVKIQFMRWWLISNCFNCFFRKKWINLQNIHEQTGMRLMSIPSSLLGFTILHLNRVTANTSI